MASSVKKTKNAQSPKGDAVSWIGIVRAHKVIFGTLAVFLAVWAGPRFGFLGALVVGILFFVCLQGYRLYKWRQQRLVLLAERNMTDPGWYQSFLDWKTEYRLLEKTRKQFAVACRISKIQGVEGNHQTPYLRNLKTTANMDVTAEVVTAGGSGVTINQIAENAHDIAEICDAAELTVRRTKSVGHANLTFYKTDPISHVIGLEDVPDSPEGTLAYGRRSDGSAAWIWQHESVLIGGLTRMGKSVTVRALLYDSRKKDVPIDLYIADPKKIQMAEWRAAAKSGERIGNIRVARYETEPKPIEDMLAEMVKVKNDRADYIIEHTLDQHVPTEEEPLLIAIIDESLSLADLLRKGTKSPLGDICFTGSASCCAVWMLSQLGDKSNIGDVRDLIPQSICYSVRSWQQMETVLGSSAKDAGAACHEIGDIPGVGWSSSSSQTRCEKFRCANVIREQSVKLATGKVETTKKNIKSDKKQACVYRARSFPDVTGGRRRLYIGKTATIQVKPDGTMFAPRFQQHVDNAKKPWWGEPGDPNNRVDWDDLWENLVWYDSEEEALAAEEFAIRTEKPIYNKIYNSGGNSDDFDYESLRTAPLTKQELKIKKQREKAVMKSIEMRAKARKYAEKKKAKEIKAKAKQLSKAQEQRVEKKKVQPEVIKPEPTNAELNKTKISWPPIKKISKPSKPAAPKKAPVVNGHHSAPESWYSE